jgi:hypothetical protein
MAQNAAFSKAQSSWTGLNVVLSGGGIKSQDSVSRLTRASSQPLMPGRQAALEDENTSVRPIEESMGCKVFSEQQTPAQNGLKRRLP